MGIRISAVLFSAVLAGLSLSCSQGHCRRKQDVQPAAAPVEAAPEPATKSAANNGLGRVMVYKYDGSLQCGGGKALSPDVMAKELTGVQVFSSVKKPDGLMHIQVCGSNTGTANVFEISAQDLKKAESKGFKKWSFE